MPADSSPLVDHLKELFAPALSGCGVELWGLEMGNRGPTGILRVFIEKEGGVTLDDCVHVSTALSAVLDVNDVIPYRYRLEVSSPGAERPLETLEQQRAWLGRAVIVRYLSGSTLDSVEGRLDQVSEFSMDVAVKDRKRGRRTVTIPCEAIESVRTSVEV